MKGVMGFEWLRQVQGDPSITSAAFELAFVILQHVNIKTGAAWPTQKPLANALRISDRHVRKLIDALVDRGHLRVQLTSGRHNPNVYRLAKKKADRRNHSSTINADKGGTTVPHIDVEKVEPQIHPNPDLGGTSASERWNSDARKVEPQFLQNYPQELPSITPVGDAAASGEVLEVAEKPRVIVTAEADLFRRGKELFGKTAGGLIKNLLKTRDGNVSLARADIEVASTKGDAREWIGAIIAGRGRDSPALSARDRGDAW